MKTTKQPQGNTSNADYADSDLDINVSVGSIYISKTYKINAKCSNCGQIHQYTIVQGIRVEDVGCRNCNCKTLFRIEL